MLDTIYDHHGPFSHDPPMDEIRIIGAKRIFDICNCLRNEGFLEVIGADYNFTILNKNCEQKHEGE